MSVKNKLDVTKYRHSVTYQLRQHFSFKLHYFTLQSYIYSVIQYVHFHSPLKLRGFYCSMPSLLHRMMKPSLMFFLICPLFILSYLPFKAKELLKCCFKCLPCLSLYLPCDLFIPFFLSLCITFYTPPPPFVCQSPPF